MGVGVGVGCELFNDCFRSSGKGSTLLPFKADAFSKGVCFAGIQTKSKTQVPFMVKKKGEQTTECIRPLDSFPASGDFCRLLITFAKSLDPDQALQNV